MRQEGGGLSTTPGFLEGGKRAHGTSNLAPTTWTLGVAPQIGCRSGSRGANKFEEAYGSKCLVQKPPDFNSRESNARMKCETFLP